MRVANAPCSWGCSSSKTQRVAPSSRSRRNRVNRLRNRARRLGLHAHPPQLMPSWDGAATMPLAPCHLADAKTAAAGAETAIRTAHLRPREAATLFIVCDEPQARMRPDGAHGASHSSDSLSPEWTAFAPDACHRATSRRRTADRLHPHCGFVSRGSGRVDGTDRSDAS
jgi:hypothetical protein